MILYSPKSKRKPRAKAIMKLMSRFGDGFGTQAHPPISQAIRRNRNKRCVRFAENYSHVAICVHGPTTVVRLALLERESLATYPAGHRVPLPANVQALSCASLISSFNRSSLIRSAMHASCPASTRSVTLHSSRRTGLPQIRIGRK